MAVLTAAVLVLSGCSQVSQNNAAAETQQSMEIEVSAETSAADSYISSFDGDLSSVNLNGFTLYIDGEAIR